jgi:hypothetical protein
MTDFAVLQMAKAIWAALLAGLGMYLVIALQMKGSLFRTPPSPEEIRRFELIFFGCAVACFSLAFWLPGVMSRAFNRREDPSLPLPLARKFPSYILRLALLESVALCGLALALSVSSGGRIWPFLGLSAFGFFLSFPSKARLESL